MIWRYAIACPKEAPDSGYRKRVALVVFLRLPREKVESLLESRPPAHSTQRGGECSIRTLVSLHFFRLTFFVTLVLILYMCSTVSLDYAFVFYRILSFMYDLGNG